MASSLPTSFSSPVDDDARLAEAHHQQWQQWQQQRQWQQQQQIGTPSLENHDWHGSWRETSAQPPGTFVVVVHQYPHWSGAIMGPPPFCWPPHNNNGQRRLTPSNRTDDGWAPSNTNGWAQNYPAQEQMRPLPFEGAKLRQKAEAQCNPWIDARHQQKGVESIRAPAAFLPQRDAPEWKEQQPFMKWSNDAGEGSQQKPQPRRKTAIRSRNKRGLEYPGVSFPRKLHKILGDPRNSECIRWNPGGRSFCILDRKALEREILPHYFRSGSFTSFSRQLNGWGFKRAEESRSIPFNSFYHQHFVEHRLSWCSKIERPASLASKAAAAKERDGTDAVSTPAVAPARDEGDGGEDREVIDDDGSSEKQKEEEDQLQHDGTAISVSENEADNEESHYKVLARLNPQLCFAVKSVLQTGQKVQTEGNKVDVQFDTTIDKAVAELSDAEEGVSKKCILPKQQHQYEGTAIAFCENETDTYKSPTPVNPYLHLAMESINKTDLQLPNKRSWQKRVCPVVSEGSPVCFMAVWSSCSNKPPG